MQFCCISNLKGLALSKWLYTDDKFSYCPKYFKHMFTIHGFYYGHSLCVYSPVSDKSTVLYTNCLKYICEFSFQNNNIYNLSML